MTNKRILIINSIFAMDTKSELYKMFFLVPRKYKTYQKKSEK